MKNYYQASETKGYKLVRTIRARHRKELGVSEKLSENRWRIQGLYQTAALSYAASTISIDGGGSLFDAIIEGTVEFEKHGHLLTAWMGRARYAAEVILSRLTKSEIAQINVDWLPDLPSEPTPEPKLTELEREEIVAEFDMAAILGGRSKTHQQLTSNKPAK